MLQQFWQWFLEPYNQRICFGLIAAFFVGLIIGRLMLRRAGKNAKTFISKGDNAFFKGIQYLLSNDHDQAIEEFTKSVQVNSDTIETYVALGNLYRSKGDIERAIRIRQTIILRPNIDEEIKLRALFDLGVDYRKGGFINRALETFLDVHKRQPSDLATMEEMEKIYEEMKDWENAFSIRQRISRRANGDHKHILAHHQAEIGKAHLAKGESITAKASFQKAISIHEGCVDAYLHLGDLYFGSQDYKKAMATWKKLARIAPKFTFLAYRRLEGAYSKIKNLKPVEDFLKECASFNSDAFTHLALARYMYNEKNFDGALSELESALDLDSSFWEARRFIGEILLSLDREDEALKAYRKLITHLNVPDHEFQCSNCGFRPRDLQWQCPQCKKWDTINFIDLRMVDAPSNHQSQRSSSRLSQENSGEEV
ncbi:tetratricopeptide repeat protein [Thermodesulfobacteriota bacterium]